jgi:FdrA protein
MPVVTKVKPKTYQDSVRLMRLSETLSAIGHVKQATVAMGTDANKRVLAEVGLLTDDVERAGANDLVIVIDAQHEEAARAAIAEAERALAESDRPAARNGGAEVSPKTLEQARGKLADANLALISVPGAYAALEAAKALQAGMNVFLFSDNVALADELALKQLAASQGLLMMGPGCGTAVINGVALGFANVLRRGPVGIVGASGTGLQELTTLIDRGGGGISQAIGVGGRDLSEAIGGIMMLQGIAMLARDPSTQLIALISKPPAAAVTDRILSAARASGKPVIVNFLGSRKAGLEGGVRFTTTIEDTAEAVLQELSGAPRSSFGADSDELRWLIDGERQRLKAGQRYLRGLFSGGSLCDEAMDLLSDALGGIYSNIPLAPELALEDAWHSQGHCCVDMGEEEFTRGRPHPMIDPRLRQERILKEASDPEVAVLLLDVVIGYGSHDDPAGALGETIRAAKAKAVAAGRYLAVVAHVCGTAQDPQGLAQQERTLREAGALILPTNAQAARVAAAIAGARAPGK